MRRWRRRRNDGIDDSSRIALRCGERLLTLQKCVDRLGCHGRPLLVQPYKHLHEAVGVVHLVYHVSVLSKDAVRQLMDQHKRKPVRPSLFPRQQNEGGRGRCHSVDDGHNVQGLFVVQMMIRDQPRERITAITVNV